MVDNRVLSLGAVSVLLLQVATADPLVVDRSTLFGGSQRDDFTDIAVADDGSVFVVGATASDDFLGTGPNSPASDFYVVKVLPDSSLGYVRVIGGDGTDDALAVTTDPAGNAYVLGSTDSTNLPTPNGFQTTFQGGSDGYVFKLDPSGNMLYGSYYGSPDFDIQFNGGIVWHPNGRVYIASRTDDLNAFPAVNAYEGSCATPPCAVIAGFDMTSSGAASLVYASYAGGNGDVGALDLGIDGPGNLYVYGFTAATAGLVVAGQGFKDSPGNPLFRDHFLLKLNPTLMGANQLVYSTYLGGVDDEGEEGAIHVDPNGTAWITGATESDGIATAGAFQTVKGAGRDAYVTKLDTTVSGAASQIWTSYLGGNAADIGWDLAVDPAGDVWLALTSTSTDLTNTVLLPEYGDVTAPGQATGMIGQIRADGQTLLQRIPVVPESPITRLKVHAGRIHLGASTQSQDVYLANSLAPSPSGGVENFHARFAIVPDSGLALELDSGVSEAAPDEPFLIRYTVRNRSTEAFSGVVLQSDFPTGAVALSLPPICTFPGTAFSCVLPDLASGESFTLYLYLRAPNAGALQFSADVSANEADNDPTDNADSTDVTIAAGAAPPGGLSLADFDTVALNSDTGEFAADSQFGIVGSSQGVDQAAVNLLRNNAGLALPVQVENQGLVVIGLLDRGQWTPMDGDVLDLRAMSNPADRVFAELGEFGRVTLFSAQGFNNPISLLSGHYDAQSGGALELAVDTLAQTLDLIQSGDTILTTDPFVPGGARAGVLGGDLAVSLGFGPDFLGAGVLAKRPPLIFANGFEN